MFAWFWECRARKNHVWLIKISSYWDAYHIERTKWKRWFQIKQIPVRIKHKKAKNKSSDICSRFFGILLGGLLCLLLVVAARHMGLISFGEADSFYDTAVSYYSEQFGDAASAQSQDPPSFARFYMRDGRYLHLKQRCLPRSGADPSGECSAGRGRIKGCRYCWFRHCGFGKCDRFPCKRDHRKEDTSGIKTSGKLHSGRHFPRLTDLTVNPSSPAAIQLDTATSRLISEFILRLY